MDFYPMFFQPNYRKSGNGLGFDAKVVLLDVGNGNSGSLIIPPNYGTNVLGSMMKENGERINKM